MTKAIRYDLRWLPEGGISVWRATVEVAEPLPALRVLVPADTPRGYLSTLLLELLAALGRESRIRCTQRMQADGDR